MTNRRRFGGKKWYRSGESNWLWGKQKLIRNEEYHDWQPTLRKKSQDVVVMVAAAEVAAAEVAMAESDGDGGCGDGGGSGSQSDGSGGRDGSDDGGGESDLSRKVSTTRGQCFE